MNRTKFLSENPRSYEKRIQKAEKSARNTAVAVSLFLTAVSLLCLIWLLLPDKSEGDYIADIFQNGILIMSIRLDGTEEPKILTVTGENGCVNRIEVKPPGIRVLSASCPDQICVKQGFIRDSGLPITCLPNRLVIRLRRERPDQNTGEPDIITY